MKKAVLFRKIIGIGLGCVAIAVSVIVCAILWRVLVADRFVIPSNSMYPTLIKGDRVLVNKLIAGARIYKHPDSLKNGVLQSWRTRGCRAIKRNDIVIFNFPQNNGKIAFKINYVYAKRCMALPGDTLSIQKGFYRNNNFKDSLGIYQEQALLENVPDSLIDEGVKYTLPFNFEQYPWTIRTFGPLYIPRQGDVMEMNAEKVLFYRQVIEYETNKKLSVEQEGRVLLDGHPMKQYCFKYNYYFMGGDHATNSGDSRYWGFVPQEYIIGVVAAILYSKDEKTGKVSWKRTKLL